MADQEDLRFTMELKDEFTDVFNKIKDTVSETVPKLKSDLGGLSKALAVVGAGVAIGGAVFVAWTMFKNKIADVTKEAEALETTLSNILGSKGAAKGVLQELANSDLTKVFRIKEIDEGYTTLANHGLKLTLAQMQSIGDLSADTGKDLGAVVNAIVRGGEGRLEAIKGLGIDVVRNKSKAHYVKDDTLSIDGLDNKTRKTRKAAVDDLTLSFRGQTTTIKNNEGAIREYLVNLGMIPAVHGSMARSAETVAGSENNLNNQMTKLWQTLGERFNPSVVESKTTLSKWVATINDWLAVPIERKIGDEIAKIKGLQTELTSANTTEERRKAILKELHELQPKITDGINDEAINYQKLADNIDAVTTALTNKITLSQIEKRYSGVIGDYTSASNLKAEANAAINQAIYAASPELAKRTDLTEGQKQVEAARILKSRGAHLRLKNAYDVYGDSVFQDIGGFINDDGSVNNSQALQVLKTGIEVNNRMVSKIDQLTPKMARMQDEKNTIGGEISKTLGLGSVAGTDKTGNSSKTSIDKGGIASVNGGGQIRNITININNLVSGGVNLQTTTLKGGMQKAKDIVVEGLLTAVNDANLVGEK